MDKQEKIRVTMGIAQSEFQSLRATDLPRKRSNKE